MGRRNLDETLVQAIKAMIWERVPQEDIARRTGVAQGTVSRIKTGRLGYDVPWPSGQLGALPVERQHKDVIEERGVVTKPSVVMLAERFMAYPQEMRELMRARVNERRAVLGLPEVPECSVELETTVFGVGSEPDVESESITLAEAAEDKRKATIMEEFEVLISEAEAEIRSRRFEDVVKRGKGKSFDPEPDDVEPARLEPEWDGLEWEEVIVRAPNNEMVKRLLDGSGDEEMKKAIGVVFKALPRTMWDGEACAKQVEEIAGIMRSSGSSQIGMK